MSERVNEQTRQVLAELLDVLDMDTDRPEELRARVAYLRGMLGATVNTEVTSLAVLRNGIRSAATYTDSNPGLPRKGTSQ